MHKETAYGFYRPQKLVPLGRASRRSSIFSIAWFACFLSFFMLGLTAYAGAPATAMLILPLMILAARSPQLALSRAIENWPLLLLPSLAFLSVAWSQYPEATLRASIQLLLTSVLAIWAGSLMNPRVFVSALLFALTLIMTVSLAVDGGASFFGGGVLQGVFESKNQLAFFAVIQFIAALAVIFDRRQHASERLLALFPLLLAPVCLMAAQSAGALVFSVPAIGTFLALTAIGRCSIMTRALVIAGVLVASAAALLAADAFVDDFSSAFDAIGKDSTLTGRTYLWQRAHEFIEQAPLLGVGYQAFWQIGNSPAEDLWAASFVAEGAGFNFHNLYLNTAVELGYPGLGLLILTLLWMAVRLFRAILLNPGYSVSFAAAIFVYLISTSFIEVLLLYPFQLGSMLLCAVWVHSTVWPAPSYGTGLTPLNRNASPLKQTTQIKPAASRVPRRLTQQPR